MFCIKVHIAHLVCVYSNAHDITKVSKSAQTDANSTHSSTHRRAHTHKPSAHKNKTFVSKTNFPFTSFMRECCCWCGYSRCYCHCNVCVCVSVYNLCVESKKFVNWVRIPFYYRKMPPIDSIEFCIVNIITLCRSAYTINCFFSRFLLARAHTPKPELLSFGMLGRSFILAPCLAQYFSRS